MTRVLVLDEMHPDGLAMLQVGRAVAERAAVFGMDLLGVDPYLPQIPRV